MGFALGVLNGGPEGGRCRRDAAFCGVLGLGRVRFFSSRCLFCSPLWERRLRVQMCGSLGAYAGGVGWQLAMSARQTTFYGRERPACLPVCLASEQRPWSRARVLLWANGGGRTLGFLAMPLPFEATPPPCALAPADFLICRHETAAQRQWRRSVGNRGKLAQRW